MQAKANNRKARNPGLKLGLLFALTPLALACSPVDFSTDLQSTQVKIEETPITCPANQVFDGTECIVPASGCTRQIKVEPINGLVTIPQRDSIGTCYYVKIFSARPNGPQPGDENLPVASDVIAANHDKPSYLENGHRYYAEKKSPLELGGREFDILIEGNWSVLISADSAESKNLFVDNFILLEALNPSGISRWIRGTRDIFPKSPGASLSEPITVGGDAIHIGESSYSGVAQGGVETVASVQVTQLFSTHRRIGFRARALDCGAGKAMSDGWLLFKP